MAGIWARGRYRQADGDTGLVYWAKGAPVALLADSGPQDATAGDLGPLLSFGDPTLIQNQLADAGDLGPLLSFGGPTLIQNDAVTVGNLGPLVSFGGPTLLQPETIKLTGLGPLLTLGGPTLVGAPVTLELTGLGPLLSFGGPRVSNTQVIQLSGGLGPLLTLGGPTLVPVPTRIVLEGLGPLLKLGHPTLSGGVADLQVFVGGVDRTAYLKWRACGLSSQTLGRWTGSLGFFSCPDGNPDYLDTDLEWQPTFGQAVVIKEHGHIRLKGALIDVTAGEKQATHMLEFTCTCQDLVHLTDRTVIPQRVYAAADYDDFRDLVLDVWADYLQPHRIGNGGIPDTMGPVTADISVNFWYATQMLDEISRLSGYQWYIDNETDDLTFVAPDDAPAAPFDITDANDHYVGLTVNTSLLDYRNKQYVVSNRPVFPQGQPSLDGEECYTLSAGRQEAANLHGLPDNFIWLQFPAATVSRIKVNGVTQTIMDDLTPEFAAYVEAHILGPEMATLWTWTAGRQWVRPYVAVSSSATVCVKYVKVGANAAVDEGDPLELTPPPTAGDSELFSVVGSGIYENVLQVNDITTQEDLDAFAAALLASSGVIPKRVTYRTKYPDLKVGMKQTINKTKHGDPFSVFITQLNGECEGPDMGEGTAFWWTVTGFNIPDPATWMTYWLRMLRRSNHPSPVLYTNAVSFALGNGGSVAEGTAITNPAVSDVSGQVKEIVAAFAVPPQGQDLILDIKQNGVSVFKPGEELIIAAGDTSLVKVTEFAKTALFIYKDDIITMDASYRDTTGEKVDADAGTVKVRILN